MIGSVDRIGYFFVIGTPLSTGLVSLNIKMPRSKTKFESDYEYDFPFITKGPSAYRV